MTGLLRALRRYFLWLLVLALPLQGLAAARQLHCGLPGLLGLQASVHAAGAGHALPEGVVAGPADGGPVAVDASAAPLPCHGSAGAPHGGAQGQGAASLLDGPVGVAADGASHAAAPDPSGVQVGGEGPVHAQDHHRCSACAACAAGVVGQALPSGSLPMPAPDLARESVAARPVGFVSHVPRGIERPPRQILA